MVYLSLSEELSIIRQREAERGGLSWALYSYVNGQTQNLLCKDPEHEEQRVALIGYQGGKSPHAEKIISRKQPKGIGYSTNIFTFVGIHLAAGGEYSSIILSRYLVATHLI